MKKTTKTKTSPAPATAPVATAKPAARSASAAPVRKPIPPAAAAPVAAPKAAGETVITAAVDVGFGNALYVRGEGAGLSWSKGVLLKCVGDAAWTISLRGSQQPVIVKFLVNDQTWSTGENFTVAPGSSVTLKPVF